MDIEKVNSAERGKSRAGKTDLLKYYNGKRLTRQQAIKAKCYECNGMGEQFNCMIKSCPLHPYSPYCRK